MSAKIDNGWLHGYIQRGQDKLPLARASVACNGRVSIKASEAVHRPAVGCIVWLDVGGMQHQMTILVNAIAIYHILRQKKSESSDASKCI